MYKLLILAAAMGSALGGALNHCPMAAGKFPYDQQKMAGEWKLVAGSNVKNKDIACGQINFKVGGNQTVVSVMGVSNAGETKGSDVLTEFLHGNGHQSGDMVAVQVKPDGTVTPVMIYTIVDTDYENYALLTACMATFSTATRTFQWNVEVDIFSRGAPIPQDKYDELTNIISGYGVDSIVKAPRVGC